MTATLLSPAPTLNQSRQDYTYTLTTSIDGQDEAQWNSLRLPGGDPHMDPRFIRTVERSMADQAKFWSVLVRDSHRRPVATACFCLYRVDGSLFMEGWAQRTTRTIQKKIPGYMRMRVLFCGLPVSGGQSHLRLAEDADHGAILRLLDDLLMKIARQERVRIVAVKEFSDQERQITDGLLDLGYLRADSLPMNHFDPRFRDLEEYTAALKAHYRHIVNRSRRKLEPAGLRAVHLKGPENIDALYTDEVHQLYLSILERAKVKLECLPAEFFRELVRQFGDEAVFTLLYQGERIVAFNCGLLVEDTYQNYFVGVEQSLNADADVYFNVMYHNLDFVLQQNVRDILVGQSANEFKARLGCTTQPRSFYVKGRGPVLSYLMRSFAPLVFPPPPPSPPRDIFKE
jgi:predicted N-acyltransferase